MDTGKVLFDSTTQSEVIHSLSEKLKAYYVFPDIAEEICHRLQKHMDDGEYNGFKTGEAFAQVLTTHIQEVNQDKHLLVTWHPELLPDQEGMLVENQEWLEEQHEQTRLDNYGLHRAERLPGNVGYLDIRAFSVASLGGNTAVAAMIFLANTSGLIFDLRKCRGGDPDMIALISSYLFGKERVHLNNLYWREGDVTEQFWTLPYVPGRRFSGESVFVLTGKETFSGGEEFAYNLKTRRRATLVGEATRGGAHPGASYRIHPHLDVFIPNGRAINPVTGTNWEGTGVLPDVSVPQEQALNMAYRMALQSIIAKAAEEQSRSFHLLVEEARAALKDLVNS